MNHIQWMIKSFYELNLDELYQILLFRMGIFLIEQKTNFLDLDNEDQGAYHFCGNENDKLIAYGRVRFLNENAYIQRVAIHENYRRQKLGNILMIKMLEFIDKNFEIKNIKLNAQAHLQLFYEKHGFQVAGQPFLDGGILHVPMQKKLINFL